MNRRALTGLALALGYALAPRPALSATDYCALACEEMASTIEATCEDTSDSKTCATDAEDFEAQCALDCATTVTVPGLDDLTDMAEAHAVAMWGTVSLISTHTYYHIDGEPNSYLLAFSSDSTLDLDEVDANARSGKNVQQYDDKLFFVEVGARIEQPPLIAYWNGISREQASLAPIDALVESLLEETDVEIVERWGTAIMPLYRIEVGEDNERYWYHPGRNAISKGGAFTDDSTARQTDAYQIHAEKLRRVWAEALDALDTPDEQ